MLLTTLHEKLALLSEFKLTYILVLPFDNELVSMSAEQFVIDILIDRLKMKR